MTLRVLSVSIAILGGCLSFGPEVTTTTPSSDHVSRCRAEIYIEPELDLQPLGFKLSASGIDDAIWFKFIAKAGNIGNVFKKGIVDSKKLSSNTSFDDYALPAWWDVKTKSLIGGQVELPNARFMNVGYETNPDGTLTAYVMWHET